MILTQFTFEGEGRLTVICDSWWFISAGFPFLYQKLQNHSTRVITKSRYDTNPRLLLNSLAWDPFCQKGEAKGLYSF